MLFKSLNIPNGRHLEILFIISCISPRMSARRLSGWSTSTVRPRERSFFSTFIGCSCSCFPYYYGK